ncbi:MAG: hypothetical protein HY688_00420 [Chloroflexi bacterium]|nr:hypothetical protein [Chloroflexota bacterium]
MIWVRRFLAVLLAVLFLPLFLVVLVLLRVNATALNPDFYVAQLRQADVYNFIHDRLLPAALDEVAKDPSQLPVDIAPLRDELLAGAREIAPPEWLQDHTEEAIRQVLPYVLGDTDSFTMTIPLRDRVEAAVRVLKKNVQEGDAFPLLYNRAIGFAAEQAVPAISDLPVGVRLSEAEAEGYLRRLVPPEWVQARMDQTIDDLTPYATTARDDFHVTLPLADRVEVAGGILKEVLSKAEIYNFVVEQVVTPFIEKNVGGSVDIALGGQLSHAEVVGAVQQVLAREWVTSLGNQVIDQTVSYLTGKSPTFAVTVPLAERKQAAFQALATLLERRLEAQFAALPECTLQQMLTITLQSNGLPSCRPPGVSYADAKKALGLDITSEIAKAVGSQIPDQWVFTEGDLRAALGPEGAQMLDRARGWVRDGVTFTEADLRKQLDTDQLQILDDVRTRIREGLTFTQADLRDALTGADPSSLETLDRVRDSLGTARRYSFLGWVLLGLIVTGIGFLGGRTWGSRLAWAAVPLAVASLLLLIITLPLYSGVARPRLVELLGQAPGGGADVAAVALDRLSQLALNAVDAFVGGLRTQAIVILAVALVAVATGIYLHRAWRRPISAPTSPVGPS